jgi:hypothetical protein
MRPHASRAVLAAIALVGCNGHLLDPAAGPGGRGPSGDDPFAEWRPSSSDPEVAGAPLDPGRVTMRRMNRTELDHTIADLLGVGPVSADFPTDDRGYGYDNIGDVLSTSALHVELLSQRAVEWIDESLGTESDPGPRRTVILTCDAEAEGEACAREILTAFARRAWRRPPTDAEIARLLEVSGVATAHGEGLDVGIELALAAALVSPHFLFHVEIDPEGAGDTHLLGDHELASRLSYFLWASMPDDELLDLADRGVLHEEAVLAEQVERMLDDERASSLVEDFAGQWLYTRLVEGHDVDGSVFPDWTPELARSARGEMERFFAVLFEDDTMPVTELLNAEFSFVDDRLAEHYELTIPSGAARDSEGFARVTMPAERHAGVLARAGMLAVTSQPNRTSPVKRGVWVLHQLMCTAPPPPPPEVEGFDSTESVPGETLRQRFERHRSDPVCASCHTLMDPIGFGLESFDAIGRHRTVELDTGASIDASGVMIDGSEFEGAAELADLLVDDPRFTECVTRQMMTYALGRGVERDDAGWVAGITERSATRGGSLRGLIHEIVLSPPFRMRTPEVER